MRGQIALAWLALAPLLHSGPAAALPSYGARVDTTCTANGWVPPKPFNPNGLDGTDPSQVNCGLCHTNAQKPGGGLTPAGDQFRRSGHTDVTPFCSPPPANQPPRFDAVPPQIATVGQLFQLSVSATDPEGGPVLLTVSNAPAGHLFVDRGDGTGAFSWTPAPGQLGSHTLTFHAADTGSPMAVASLDATIAVGQAVNRAPVLAPIGNQQVEAGVLLSFALSAQDPDGDSLTYGVQPLPAGASLSGSLFSWTPDANQRGNHSVTFSVADDGTPPAMDSEAIAITVGIVNRPPQLAPIGDRSVPVGTATRIALSASDPDGDALRIDCSGLPGDATFSDFQNGTAEIAWAPLAVGSYAASCNASDAGLPPELDSEAFALAAVQAPPAADAGAPVLDDAWWEFGGKGGRLLVVGSVPSSSSMPAAALVEVGIYAVLADGTSVLLGALQTRGVGDRFGLSLKPFVAPCAVAAGVNGVLGDAISVRNAPAGCDSELLLRVKARLDCRDQVLRIAGRRAALGGMVVASDAATGAELASIPVLHRAGRFASQGAVSGQPQELEIRLQAGDHEWRLDRPLPVRQGRGCVSDREAGAAGGARR